jgi:hypothetical protein
VLSTCPALPLRWARLPLVWRFVVSAIKRRKPDEGLIAEKMA